MSAHLAKSYCAAGRSGVVLVTLLAWSMRTYGESSDLGTQRRSPSRDDEGVLHRDANRQPDRAIPMESGTT